ncbi:MAG: hypothetical protein FWF60_09085 [Oscillospiraceae bacterium]|nr:hypothetical protein [Oscillospiraceae bacterium]
MKKILCVFLTLALLTGFGAVGASAFEMKRPVFELPAFEAAGADAENPDVDELAASSELTPLAFLAKMEEIDNEIEKFDEKLDAKWGDLTEAQWEALVEKMEALQPKIDELHEEFFAKLGEGDLDGALKAYQKANLIVAEFFQYEATVMMPASLIKALGASSFVEFFKFLGSCIVRYIGFGWAWMIIR